MNATRSLLALGLLGLAAAPLAATPRMMASQAPGGKAAVAAPARSRTLAVKPAVELPEDYDAILSKAAKAGATLQVLPIRSAQGGERAFTFAQVALASGLFAKVSVGDELGKADYAVAGSWEGGHQRSLGSGAGLGAWMDLQVGVDLDLVFEGKPFDRVVVRDAKGQVYSPPPFTAAKLIGAAEQGLEQCFKLALYRLAKDIRKRSGL